MLCVEPGICKAIGICKGLLSTCFAECHTRGLPIWGIFLIFDEIDLNESVKIYLVTLDTGGA